YCTIGIAIVFFIDMLSQKFSVYSNFIFHCASKNKRRLLAFLLLSYFVRRTPKFHLKYSEIFIILVQP
ncbi:hypothetical protein DRQ00_03630, partial [candidate division KSB1 bacterium]